eukprot:COSAG05_NODE_9628_length_611_cov_0.654297_1_plen_60_part_01
MRGPSYAGRHRSVTEETLNNLPPRKSSTDAGNPDETEQPPTTPICPPGTLLRADLAAWLP